VNEIGGLSMITPEQRKLLKLFYKAHGLAFEEWEVGDYKVQIKSGKA
jgi:hypothetical protein